MKFKQKNRNNLKKNKNNNNTSSTLAFNPDYEYEETQISYIFTHTEYQLANVIKSNKISLAVVSVTLHDDMMENSRLNEMKQNNQPEFCAQYQMNLYLLPK